MHSSLDVKGLIDFYMINIDTGHWEPVKDEEHPSTAVPKVVHQLADRTQKIISNLASVISDTITKVQNIAAVKVTFHQHIDMVSAELNIHIQMLHPFTQTVRAFIRSEDEQASGDHPSPRALLHKMSRLQLHPSENDTTAKSSQHLLSVMNTHERLDHQEIINKLESSRITLQKIQEILPKIEFCWNQMIKLDSVDDPEALIFKMREIQNGLTSIQDSESLRRIYDAFFTIDDASIGLLHIPALHGVDVDKVEATLKLIRVVQRTLLKGLNKYKDSDEKILVEKAFQQIKKFNELNVQAAHIQALEKVPYYLEIEPSTSPSMELCFRKFGELHSNIRQKQLELTGLNPLQKYFPQKLQDLSNRTIAQLDELQKRFMAALPKSKNTSPRNETVHELDITARMLKNCLKPSLSAEEFFEINKKLHKINHDIRDEYAKFTNPAIFQSFIEILGSNLFRDFITSLSELMLELEEEQKYHPNTQVESDDLKAVGIATGKTTMIDSYEKALEEIIAPLSTFMCNSLHQLVKEMLKNTPMSNPQARAELKKAYEVTSQAIADVEGTILSKSDVLVL